jgi:aryl carrier-like protein
VRYLGRIDRQVKIRGLRLELGEIESVFVEHEAVQQAAVVTQRYGTDDRLIAYWVGSEDLTEAELSVHLARKLPEYMLPFAYAKLSALPLLASGKVNREALSAVLPSDLVPIHRTGRAPATATEEYLATLWSELLNVAEVKVDDDFFGLGGHSLLALRLVHRIREQRGVAVEVQTVFRARTLEKLALHLDHRPGAFVAPELMEREALLEAWRLFGRHWPNTSVVGCHFCGDGEADSNASKHAQHL